MSVLSKVVRKGHLFPRDLKKKRQLCSCLGDFNLGRRRAAREEGTEGAKPAGLNVLRVPTNTHQGRSECWKS